MFENHKYDLSGLSIAFNQHVEVTESFIPEFSVTTFLAELGGSLGLWLGVGAVQLLNLGVAFLAKPLFVLKCFLGAFLCFAEIFPATLATAVVFGKFSQAPGWPCAAALRNHRTASYEDWDLMLFLKSRPNRYCAHGLPLFLATSSLRTLKKLCLPILHCTQQSSFFSPSHSTQISNPFACTPWRSWSSA